jgi:hypothetical protein
MDVLDVATTPLTKRPLTLAETRVSTRKNTQHGVYKDRNGSNCLTLH